MFGSLERVAKPISENRWASAGLVVGASLVPLVFFWGYSVDDAWIVARVASRLVTTGHASFHDEPTDAVTPILFPYLLWPLLKLVGTSSVSDAFQIARWFGVFCYLTVSALLGLDTVRCGGSTWTASFLVLVAGSLAAYAGSGLETSLIALLFYWGTRPGPSARSWARSLVLGCAVGLRHELAFAALASLALEIRDASRGRRFRWLVVFLVGCAIPVAVRFLQFRELLPLSFQAKTPDFSHGLRYALGGAIFTGLVPMAFLAASERRIRVSGLVVAHCVALVFAGGDWMPLYRLFVPILPTLIAESALGGPPNRRARVAVLAVVCGCCAIVPFYLGADAREVLRRRTQWLDSGRAALAGAKNVAAVDVGWVGAVHPGAVTDLGGVTDPRIGKLPGGHTSKSVPIALFGVRGVDAYVVRDTYRDFRLGGPYEWIRPVYTVDARLLPKALELDFVATATFPIVGTSGQYVVFRESPTSATNSR